MMIFGSIESLLGSIWFAGLTFCAGYLLAHIWPVSAFKKK